MTSSIHIKYEWFLNRSIWSLNGTLSDMTPLGQSGPGSNGNEGIFHTPQISRTGASAPDAV